MPFYWMWSSRKMWMSICRGKTTVIVRFYIWDGLQKYNTISLTFASLHKSYNLIITWAWILRRFYIIISMYKVITKNLFLRHLIHELINHVRQIDAQTDRQTDAISEYWYGYISFLSVRVSWIDVDNLMKFQIHHHLISKQFSWDGSYEWLLIPSYTGYMHSLFALP